MRHFPKITTSEGFQQIKRFSWENRAECGMSSVHLNNMFLQQSKSMDRFWGPLLVGLKPQLRRELHLLVLFIYLHIIPLVQDVLTGFDGIYEKGRNTDYRHAHTRASFGQGSHDLRLAQRAAHSSVVVFFSWQLLAAQNTSWTAQGVFLGVSL